MTFRSINPATGEVIAEYQAAEDQEIEHALARAAEAYSAWRSASFEHRARILRRFGDLMKENADALALTAAREMGKPVSQGKAEPEKCGYLANYFADHAASMLAAEARDIDGADARVEHAPLGAIFSITPWNFPFWQIVRAAIPPISAGDVVINKPAPNVIGCAREVVALFEKAGAPPGVLQTISVTNDDAARIIADDQIAGVAFTGSEKAGAAVASTAGANLKKVVLELGGSDPFIVLGDADVEAAAKVGAKARFMNAGQVCIAAKRFIIEETVRDKFEEAFLAEVDALKLGDPAEQNTGLGPMAREDLRDQLDEQAQKTLATGGEVVRRGGPLDGAGFFYEPTVFRSAPEDSPAFREETFGPLALLVSARDENEAVAIANDTRFGLSANLWTGDTERAKRLIPDINAGGVFVNSMTSSDPRLPFGGVKNSGFGRELGREGLLEFVNTRTVYERRR